MARWICNNCSTHFEGGIFNTRNCPHCYHPLSEFFKVIFNLLKFAVIVVPLLIIIKLVSNPTFENIVLSVKNLVKIDTAIYYQPSLYFNNLFYLKDDSYYILRERKFVYRRIVSSEYTNKVAPYLILPAEQTVLAKGLIRKDSYFWIAAEFYKEDLRQRVFILAPKNWEAEMARVDRKDILDRAKNEFRNAVLSAVGYKEVGGKDNIKKFMEENSEYFRLEIEDTSFLKPFFQIVSPQYELAYFVLNSDKNKVDELKEKYLNINLIEKNLLQLKSGQKN
jgi:hypothetical protein